MFSVSASNGRTSTAGSTRGDVGIVAATSSQRRRQRRRPGSAMSAPPPALIGVGVGCRRVELRRARRAPTAVGFAAEPLDHVLRRRRSRAWTSRSVVAGACRRSSAIAAVSPAATAADSAAACSVSVAAASSTGASAVLGPAGDGAEHGRR